MPLLDHFHPPLSVDRHWESLHAAWAGSVCTSIANWRTSINSLADLSGGALTRDALRERLQAADKATEKLLTELKDLGPPHLKAGDKLKQRLNSDADSLRASYESLKASAQDAASAGSLTGFLSALAKLGPPFQDLVNRINTTVTDLRNANIGADEAELRQAFDNSASCKKLRAQQG